MTVVNPKGRLLALRAALRGHAARVRRGLVDTDALALDLEHMATECGEVAVELTSPIDGIPADGPPEVDARDEAFDAADTQPIMPIGRRKPEA